MTWTEKTQQAETWSEKSQQAEAWGAASEQSETWTRLAQETRVFSPDVFSHAFHNGTRVFAVGSAAGVWDVRTQQAEVWA